MLITPVKTDIIRPNKVTLLEILDKSLSELPEKSVLAITSKIVSLCEGRVIPINQADEEDLIKQESDYYIPASKSSYGHHFTVIGNTLISVAGIDKSNSADHFVLWPSNPQATANQVRQYLKNRFKLQNVGVVITDSTSMPFRLGTTGVALGYSGFEALNNYVGTPDLFGRPFEVSRANIANGLAVSAVTVMGEGAEQTPLAIIQDASFINFLNHDPTAEELEYQRLTLESDIFEVFYKNAPWERGDGNYPGKL